jgi:F0F1-type ATP synthase alpha subunit
MALAASFSLIGKVLSPVGTTEALIYYTLICKYIYFNKLKKFNNNLFLVCSNTKSENIIIENTAPSIMRRTPISESLKTGIKFLDSMIPIGCGQRELIIGDKKIGKTTVAIDIILNQKNSDVFTFCIYVAIGQKKSAIAYLASFFC